MRCACLIGIAAMLVQIAAAQVPPLAQVSAPSASLICTHQQRACAALVSVPVTGSLAARERERAEHSLERLQMSWQVVYLLVPTDDPEAVDELNQLLIAQLTARMHAADSAAVSSK
jgi:hypothetical protein